MTTYCSKCHGLGALPTGGPTMTSAVNMSWSTCKACDGTGTVVECSRCLGTGIDLEAPVNVANPPQCPACTASQHAA